VKYGLFLGLIALAGCVFTKNVTVSNDRTKEWQGKMGAVAMIEAGKTIVNENEIEDPAPVLAVDSSFKVRLIDVHAGSLLLKSILATQRDACLQQLGKDVLGIT
jgi:hypothetical protein